MSAFSWFGALLLVGAGGHARLHPADSDVYVEVPDVAALAPAYVNAPLVRLLAVPEMEKLRAAAGMDALEPAKVMLSMLKPRTDVEVDEALASWSESSFGPETPLAFLALAAAASQWGTRRALEIGASSAIVPRAQAKERTPDRVPTSGLVPTSDLERERTEATPRAVRTGLAVFKSTQGGLHPTALDHLVVPTDSFPKGFLDGASVPQDAWGRDFVYTRLDQGRAYTLWSRGPDGVDQSGRGDDVRLP